MRTCRSDRTSCASRTQLLPALVTALALVGMSVPSQVASAATFVVNSTADAPDNNPGDGTCETAPDNGECTLPAAVAEFAAEIPSSSNVIVVPAGTYTLSNGLTLLNVNAVIGDGSATTLLEITSVGPAIGRSFMEHLNDPISISGVTVHNSAGPGIVNSPGGPRRCASIYRTLWCLTALVQASQRANSFPPT